ncbi:carbohydrate ABC transporter substrate-binding protein [Halomonas sp. MCCC 1A17488]|uniref:Probable sugar-binding periplasmic protein n=1 Tax=Billgrantia sulfidoxydans TaxID=2733484 RepID=A0ABX7W1T7_9GAMM|nr:MULTISPECIES: ABC transporter substrate-binding protein [Halomonas]MCE8015873.1 carbohydrate ABC transporter substrate-binding protein [Halomonas sp. MCCC 1A17488]MCG3239206.1 carbohydrate ABC transporter substrate-binding protein [Halomonas sp. MCCC 1A17488]QPP50858.1 carbohydrate ABC transporter substrate-binding protein [Halomonas sp. SS10-MC5]QTP54383.1 carbohydrate ABC transporter substrate-binding protein [Halomonas sulfidoxydans]
MPSFARSFNKTTLALATAAAASLALPSANAAEVEVLHWWTSGGEARAANVLKELMEAEGYGWEDFAVAGGGGETAMTVLKSRAMSGNPPSAAQIKGPEIQEWGELGLLGELDEVAEAEGWDELLPPTVAEVMRHDGSYVAVPVNVHRVNWLWANPEVLEAAGVEMPTTLDELFSAGEAIREAGYIPLAHGGQAWQDATVFETVLLATGGTEFYQQALVELDEEALGGEQMVEALETFKRLRELMDDDMSGRDWNIATSMVIEGTAGMQLMGDWAKGEFTAAGLTAGEDYLCAAAPGTQDAFTFNIDSLAMFRVEGEEREAQQALARLVLEPTFQEAFNLAKGSIPARPDLDMGEFDSCAQQSMQDFQRTAEEDGLVPSMAHGMAVRADVQGAIFDVVTNYFNSRDMAAEEAARRMVNAAQAAL